MGLLQKLKSALGIGGSSGPEHETGRPTDVTVEHEPAVESEAAVKGTDGATGSDATDESAGAATNRTADESAKPTGDDEASPDESAGGTAAEPAAADEAATEASDEGTEAAGSSAAEAEAEAESDTADAESDTADAKPESTAGETVAESASGSTDPVDEINGIGAAYAERLNAAGVETVGDLAGADVAAVAEETDISEKRLQGWVDQAREY